MPYQPLYIDPSAGVPPSVEQLARQRIDMYLADVRGLLATPAVSTEASYNFTIVAMLCGVIAGLSRIFVNHDPNDNKSFQAALARYPYSLEPAGAITHAAFSETLYEVFRCGLVHSFGFNMKKGGSPLRYTIEPLPYNVKVNRIAGQLSEAELKELEDRSVRPRGLVPTLADHGGGPRLYPEPLYWGVRKTAIEWIHDSAAWPSAVSVLTPWFSSQLSASPVMPPPSAGTPAPQTRMPPNFTGVESSTGPVSSTMWDWPKRP